MHLVGLLIYTLQYDSRAYNVKTIRQYRKQSKVKSHSLKPRRKITLLLCNQRWYYGKYLAVIGGNVECLQILVLKQKLTVGKQRRNLSQRNIIWGIHWIQSREIYWDSASRIANSWCAAGSIWTVPVTVGSSRSKTAPWWLFQFVCHMVMTMSVCTASLRICCTRP